MRYPLACVKREQVPRRERTRRRQLNARSEGQWEDSRACILCLGVPRVSAPYLANSLAMKPICRMAEQKRKEEPGILMTLSTQIS